MRLSQIGWNNHTRVSVSMNTVGSREINTAQLVFMAMDDLDYERQARSRQLTTSNLNYNYIIILIIYI